MKDKIPEQDVSQFKLLEREKSHIHISQWLQRDRLRNSKRTFCEILDQVSSPASEQLTWYLYCQQSWRRQKHTAMDEKVGGEQGEFMAYEFRLLYLSWNTLPILWLSWRTDPWGNKTDFALLHIFVLPKALQNLRLNISRERLRYWSVFNPNLAPSPISQPSSCPNSDRKGSQVLFPLHFHRVLTLLYSVK